jgi:hypothetical protein
MEKVLARAIRAKTISKERILRDKKMKIGERIIET